MEVRPVLETLELFITYRGFCPVPQPPTVLGTQHNNLKEAVLLYIFSVVFTVVITMQFAT